MAVAALLVSVGVVAAPAQAAAASVKVGRAQVSPARYTGACPATTTFAAKVAVRGAARLTYRWLRGDGTKGPVTTVRVKGGTVLLRDKQTYAGSTSGWQALQVLSPRQATSNKARFSVTCEEPPSGVVSTRPTEEPAPRATASLAEPAPYSGACPLPGHNVTFTGTITVSRTPAAVAYRWVDSDGGASPVERLWFAAGGPASKAVTSQRAFLTTQSGTRRLEILDAQGRVAHRSGAASYRVTCTPAGEPEQPKAAVTNARVTPADYAGACTGPLEFVFTADLAVTRPTRVAYEWVRSDGARVPGAVVFKGDLTTTVSTTWKVPDPEKLAGGSATLRVTTPNQVTSAPATFKITCRDDVVTVEPARIRLVNEEPGPCTTRNPYEYALNSGIAPTPHAKLPLEVSYRWRWSDGSFSAPMKWTAKTPGGMRFGNAWTVRTSKAGKVWLEVTAAGKTVRSEPVSYEVICDGKPPTQPSPVVVSVTDAVVTPSNHNGPCPLNMRAKARITVSAPMAEPVAYRWVFDNYYGTSTQYVSFPAGGPLSKDVEYLWLPYKSTDHTVTGYLEVRLPNMIASDMVSYTITCS